MSCSCHVCHVTRIDQSGLNLNSVWNGIQVLNKSVTLFTCGDMECVDVMVLGEVIYTWGFVTSIYKDWPIPSAVLGQSSQMVRAVFYSLCMSGCVVTLRSPRERLWGNTA